MGTTNDTAVIKWVYRNKDNPNDIISEAQFEDMFDRGDERVKNYEGVRARIRPQQPQQPGEDHLYKGANLNEVTVTPNGAYNSDVKNLPTLETTEEPISDEWRKRFAKSVEQMRNQIKKRNLATADIYNTLYQHAIDEAFSHPSYGDEVRRNYTDFPQLYINRNGELDIKHYSSMNGVKSPMKIVSPEFDLLSLGIGSKAIGTATKGLFNMLRSPRSYTGVPSYFLKYFSSKNGKLLTDKTFNVFTTPYSKIADTYAKGGTRAMETGLPGRTFRVYTGKNNKVLKLESPTEGKYYTDRRMPFLEDTKNGRIVKSKYLTDQYLPKPYISKNQKGFVNEQMMGRVSDAQVNTTKSLLNDSNPIIRKGAQHKLAELESNIKLKQAIIIPEQEAIRFRPVGRTDGLISIAKRLGYDGVEIPKIIDGGYYYKNGEYIMQPFTERIYADPSKLIFAPTNESFMKTYMANYGEDLMGGLLKTASGIAIGHSSKR